MHRLIDYRMVAARGLSVAGLLVFASLPSVVASQQTGTPCRPTGPLVRLPELPEAIGIAVSRRVADRLWAHNDSGEPVIFALDAKGTVTGRVRLTGATVEDWEAIAVADCIDVATNVLRGLFGVMMIRRYVKCWQRPRSFKRRTA